jgi:type IV pilus assembly protein PilF
VKKPLFLLFVGLVFVFGGCATLNRDPSDIYSDRQLQDMGEKFLAARDLGQALKYLTLAEKRRPNDPVIQYDLGLAYYERGLRSEALVHLKKALTLKPVFSEAENAMGRYYAEQGQYDQAQQAFQKVLADPFYSTPQLAFYNMGLIYEKKGEPEAALKQYHEAVRLKPNYGVAYYRMGQILEELHRADQARDAYSRAIEFAPELAEAHYRYGVMSYAAGELENALYSLNRVVKLAPYSTMAEDARRYLERLHAVIPAGPSSRGAPMPPGERVSQLEVMTNREVLNEPSQAATSLAGRTSAPNLESLQVAKIGTGIAEPSLEASKEVPEDRPPEGPRAYIVQLGSFLDKDNAEDLQQRLRRKGYDAVVKPFNHQVLGQLFVVQLKPVNDAEKASRLMLQVEREGHGKAIILEVPAN